MPSPRASHCRGRLRCTQCIGVEATKNHASTHAPSCSHGSPREINAILEGSILCLPTKLCYLQSVVLRVCPTSTSACVFLQLIWCYFVAESIKTIPRTGSTERAGGNSIGHFLKTWWPGENSKKWVRSRVITTK